MPEANTVRQAKRKLRRGRSPSTAAGEFVREEIHHVREGKHGARSAKQAIAIGLSKARRAGVPLPPKGRTGAQTRKAAKRDVAAGRSGRKRTPSRRRSRAVKRTLRRETRRAASHRALARQARQSSSLRGRRNRVAAARRAVRTKGARARRRAARQAANTRRRHAAS